MGKYRLYSLALLSLSCAGTIGPNAFAETASGLPVVEILGRRYYVYEVKKGDSLFGISRDFNWNDSELQRLNPGAMADLRRDMKIYYPVDFKPEGNDSPTARVNENLCSPGEKSDKVEKYVIKKGDTLYRLASDNKTTVTAILKLNPGVSEHNFRAGATILIPAAGTGVQMISSVTDETRLEGFDVYRATKEDTWVSVARRFGISVESLRKSNPGVDKIRNKLYLTIPRLKTVEVERIVENKDPREHSPEGVRNIYEEIHGISPDLNDYTVKVALVMEEPAEMRNLEYTRGFLTGINSLKNSGYKIHFKIVDGMRPAEDVITELDGFKPSMVISLSEKKFPESLAEYGEVSRTPVVNALDARDTTYLENPYVVQLIAPSDIFNAGVARWFRENYGERRLVFTGACDQNDQLADALRADWKSRPLTVTEEDLQSLVSDENDGLLLYGSMVKKAEVSKFLAAVKKLRDENPLADITVLGRPNWIVYDESLSGPMHEVETLIPSRFYMNSESMDSKRFAIEYKSLFDREPARSFPVYSALGYDTAKYFIKSFGDSKGDFNTFTRSDESVQSDFEMRRQDNWTGIVNPIVYVVRFSPEDVVDRIIVE